MPLYLVRWPGLEASIVRAKNETTLRQLLEEVGDPTHATYKEYEGPLWVDVSLGIQAERHDGGKWSIDGAKKASARPWLGAAVQAGESETADEMIAAVFAGGFPHLTRVVQDADDEELDPKKVRAAAIQELDDHAPAANGVGADA